MPVTPQSPEVVQEAAEREAVTATLWNLWHSDPATDGLQFHSPVDLCRWVVRRLVADADRTSSDSSEDHELRTIADGVSRLVGRETSAQVGP